MAYIITNDQNRFVSRNYHGDHTATDYLLPLTRVYGGRLTATGALTFDTLKAARFYADHNTWIPGIVQVREYNACCNSVGGEVI